MKKFEIKDHVPSLIPEGERELAWADEFDGGTAGKVSTYLDYGYFGVLAALFDDEGHSVGEFAPKKSYYAYQNFLGAFGDGAEKRELPLLYLPKYAEHRYEMDLHRVELISGDFLDIERI